MERMDGDEHHVAVLVDEFDRFLCPAAHMGFHQTAVLSDAVVDMHHIIAHPQRVQVADGHLLGLFHLAPDAQLMIALKDLMVCIITILRGFVDIPFVEGKRQEERLDITQDLFQTARLALVGRKDRDSITLYLLLDDVIGE